MKRAHNYTDRAGLRHYHLLCLGDSGQRTKNGQVLWLWACDCGRQVHKTYCLVRQIKTCGLGCPLANAMRSETNRANALCQPLKSPPGYSGLRRMYETYVRRCAKKKVKFELSLEEFKALTSAHCYYCGREPQGVYRHSSKDRSTRAIEHGKYPNNTIDRIDSSAGYVAGNCRTACKQCNVMKWNHSEQEFIDHITRLYVHLVKPIQKVTVFTRRRAAEAKLFTTP